MKDRKKAIPNNIFFEDIIAKAILFRTAEKLYGKKPNAIGELRYIVVPFALSWLNKATDYKLSLEKIWKQQALSSALETLLKDVLIEVENFMKATADGALYSEWAKREECWNKLQEKLFPFPLEMIKNDIETVKSNRQILGDEEQIKLEQQEQIKRIKSIPVKHWKRIEEWGFTKNTLSQYQRTTVLNLCSRMTSNGFLSEIQIKSAIEILDKVIDEVPELLHDIDDVTEITQKVKSETITLDIVKAIVIWDKTRRRLQDYEWKFMDALAKEVKPFNQSNQGIATKNWEKVKKYGFM